MAMMKIKWIGLIISYLPVSKYLIDSDSEYIIVSLWNIVGCINLLALNDLKSTWPVSSESLRPDVLYSCYWSCFPVCSAGLIVCHTLIQIQANVGGLERTIYGYFRKHIFCLMFLHECLLMLQLVIVQVLTFVAWVQLSQNELARTTVSCMLYLLLYCNISHTALHPSVSSVAGIVPYLSNMIQEHIPLKDTFSTESS